jgi:hypothetical protein
MVHRVLWMNLLSDFTHIYMWQEIPTISVTSELYLVTGNHGCRDTKKPLQHCSVCCNPSDGGTVKSKTCI